MKEWFRTSALNPGPPDYQSNMHPIQLPGQAANRLIKKLSVMMTFIRILYLPNKNASFSPLLEYHFSVNNS